MRFGRFRKRRVADRATESSDSNAEPADRGGGVEDGVSGGAEADQPDETAAVSDGPDEGAADETGSASAAPGVGSSEHAPLRLVRSWRWRVVVGLGLAVATAGVAVLSVFIYTVFDDGGHDGKRGDTDLYGRDDGSWASLYGEGAYASKQVSPGARVPCDCAEAPGHRRYRGSELRWGDRLERSPLTGWFGIPGAPGAAVPFAKGWGGESGSPLRGFGSDGGWFGHAPFADGRRALPVPWAGRGFDGGSGWFGYAPFDEGGPAWRGRGFDGDEGGPALRAPWPGLGHGDDYAEEHRPGEELWREDGRWSDDRDGDASGFGLGGLEVLLMWLFELLSDPEMLSGILGLLDGLPGGDGSLGGLFGFDGEPDGLFGPDGPLGGLLEFEGDGEFPDGLFDPDGPLGELFGPDGPFGDLLDGATVEEPPLPGRTAA